MTIKQTKFLQNEKGEWTAFPVKDSIYIIVDHANVDWSKSLETWPKVAEGNGPAHFEMEGLLDHNTAMQVLALLNAPEENMGHLGETSFGVINLTLRQLIKKSLTGAKAEFVRQSADMVNDFATCTYVVTFDGKRLTPVTVNAASGEDLYAKLLESFKQFK